MKSKLLTLILMTAFLSLALVSAADFITVTSGDTLTKTDFDSTFTINNNVAEVLDLTIDTTDVIIKDDNNKELVFSISSVPATIAADGEAIITYTLNPDTGFDFEDISLGEMLISTISINASNATDSEENTLGINFYNSYSKDGVNDNGDLDKDVDVQNKAGYGEEDDEWYPLDEIQIEVEVENDASDTIDDIVVEWCLYDYDEAECIMEEEEDDFKLKEDKEETVTITFQLDPNDLNEGSDSYALFIKVYSDDSDYSEIALEEVIPISIMMDNFVILEDVTISLNPVICDADVELIARVWNLGEDDQEDVFVRIYNNKLGINEQIQMGDIDALESKTLTYNFIIPKGTLEGNYDLELGVYDEDSDIFENSDDKESREILRLKIEGNCVIETENAVIAAQLDSETPEAIAGKQVIIKATVTNTGDLDSVYSISLIGNSAWSSLVAIDPQTINLNAGDSKEITIYLDLDSDAQGDKEFTIKATSSNGIITEQDVAFTIEEGVTQDAILSHLQDNWFIYVIVIVNLILIIAIVAVIKRMAVRPASVM